MFSEEKQGRTIFGKKSNGYFKNFRKKREIKCGLWIDLCNRFGKGENVRKKKKESFIGLEKEKKCKL